MRRGFLLLVLALAACDEPPGLAKEDVCDAICSCFYGLPAQIDTCVQQCEAQLPDPTPACKSCVDDSTCSAIDDCSVACFGAPKEIP